MGNDMTGMLSRVNVNVNKLIKHLKTKGVKATAMRVKGKVLRKLEGRTEKYNIWFHKHKASEEELEKQRQQSFDYEPVFSILVPLYETDEAYLKELIDSIQNQTYGRWQLCFSDGSKDCNRLKCIIASYAKEDDRIEYVAEKKGPLGISENTNQALTIVKGDYIVLGDHDDLFAPDALYECVKALNTRRYDIIYTDEDKIDEKGRMHFDPNFKPDFNIDLLCSNNYICHMFVVSKVLADKVGSFNDAFNGSQDYDYILRCVENSASICHIPKVLYHWRAHKASTAGSPEAKLYAFEAGKRAVQAHYDRIGVQATVEAIDEYGFYKTTYEVNGNPKVSIVISNMEHIRELKKCMDSIDQLSDYRNYEYIIIENNRVEKEHLEYYAKLEDRENVKILHCDKELAPAAIYNLGVGAASGEYVWLLHNDTKLINNDCITQMLSYCQRAEVGIVGARLYNKNGSIQHAGMIMGGDGIARYVFSGLYEESGLYMARTKVACDYSAVTASCMMVRKDVFEQLGGFDETFKSAFYDVDFCMKVRELGKLVVYNPNARLYHYEKKSKGKENSLEKQYIIDHEYFTGKWSEILKNPDPYYNVNLSLDKLDFSVRE